MAKKKQSLYDWCIEHNMTCLLDEWDTEKNEGLTPYDVYPKSDMEVWWKMPYDDPKTGKHFDFEWPAKISDRTNGKGCPYLLGRRKWKGYNTDEDVYLPPKRLRKSHLFVKNLAETYPELAAQWHPTKNGDLTPECITRGSNRIVWWYLPYDDPKTGKHFDFEWAAPISSRTRHDNGCPFLSNKEVWTGYNDLATVCPNVATQWHPTLNGDLRPENVLAYSRQKVWWLKELKNPVTGKVMKYQWQESVVNRTAINNCSSDAVNEQNRILDEMLTCTVKEESMKLRKEIAEKLMEALDNKKALKALCKELMQ